MVTQENYKINNVSNIKARGIRLACTEMGNPNPGWLMDEHSTNRTIISGMITCLLLQNKANLNNGSVEMENQSN